MKRLIHIGANTGENDESVRLVKDQEYWGLFVEPNPLACDALRIRLASYEARVVIDQVAIRNYDGDGTLYIDGKNNVSMQASFNLEFLHAHGQSKEKANKIQVKCITLRNLFRKHGLVNQFIDWLIIDTEGCDSEIVLGTDFKEFNVSKIMFEHAHTDGPCVIGKNLDKMIEHLRDCGYKRIRQHCAYNTIAEK